MVFQAPFTEVDIFSINAKATIKDVNEAVAPANFLESIKHNAATAPAISAIATVIAVRLALQSFAPLVAQIIAVITAPRADTAATPLTRAFVSTSPNNTDTTASAPIAIEMANMVAVTLAVCSVLEIVVTLTNAATNTKNPAANSAPFIISAGDN